MTTYQFYPSCFPTTHTFYKKCLLPQSKDTFIDISKPQSRWKTRLRQLKYLISGDIGFLFGYDSLSKNVDMLYSNGPIYCGKHNWVLDIMDSPYGMTGYNFNIFKKNIKRIEYCLSRDNCKKIIARCQDTINIMKKYFSNEVISKISLELLELPKKIYIKEKKSYFQILFIGSINNPGDFYNKGGLIALAAIERLGTKNIKLIMRCDIPKELSERIRSNPHIKLINYKLTDEELDALYKQSDLLICTNPVMPFMATLEAKAYGIPIVCYDVFGIRSYIETNDNGFILIPPKDIQDVTNEESYPCDMRLPHILEAVKKIDPETLNSVCYIITKLKNEKE